MANIPQEDYIRQLLDETLHSKNDDSPDEDEEDRIEVCQENMDTEQEGKDNE
ncbi:hypothetical protein J6590_083313 [Homalodisca vitripennis]|nr:hypothetical protein J6590_095194 [Homalodisca vitripennis]KAG8324799.1 hypothetical protein J6590_083313 [Homalodisca vitripennis]